MSDTGVTALGSAKGFKVPESWDKARPEFYGSEPEAIEEYIEDCNTVIEKGKIVDEQDKKRVYVKYLKTAALRDQWKTLKSFKDTAKTAQEFIEEVLTFYPEVKELKNGSTAAMAKLCRENKGIRIEEEGKLKRFGMAFKSLYSKLSGNNPVITNKEACDKYIGVLENSFKSSLRNALANAHILEEKLRAIGVPQATQRAHRQEDPIELEVLVDLAESMARSKNVDESGDESEPEDSGSRKKRVRFEYVKNEPVDEKLGGFEQALSSLKDSVLLIQKENQHSNAKFEELIRTFQQAKIAPAPRPPSPGVYQDSRFIAGVPQRTAFNGGRSGYQGNPMRPPPKGDCHYCQGLGHWSRECPSKEEHIKKGWLHVGENGSHKLGDGGWIPGGDAPQSQKVEEYWARKGAAKANYQAGPYASTYFNQGEADYVTEYPEDAIDEIRSLRAQLANFQAAEPRAEPSSYVQHVQPAQIVQRGAEPSSSGDMANQFLQRAMNQAVQGLLSQAFSGLEDSQARADEAHDEEEEEEVEPLVAPEFPFKDVVPVNQGPLPEKDKAGEKYKLRAPIQKTEVVDSVVMKLKRALVDAVTVEEILAVSEAVRDAMVTEASRKRVPVKQAKLQDQALPFVELRDESSPPIWYLAESTYLQGVVLFQIR
ncbi:hypothetical protein FB45DRAFT_869370 [Roridomyces roridus]|uniref:CCHC-type domain-containing protein n=1 Tax=Roridomyces roridus TaxID=1738132 RepID=A0AAD7FJZ3_9AGAR|nr:hypothetical protein FB45DRAFT_869370 [Roridomyces roridus]